MRKRRKNEVEVIKIIYRQNQLDFVEHYIMKKYCPNKVGYTIKVIDDCKRASKIMVYKDRIDELIWLCSECNIEVRQEVRRS